MRNSGFLAGKFLDRRRFKNVVTGEWFKSSDFSVGKKLTINGYVFEILEADEATVNIMKGGGVYTKATVDEIIKGITDALWDKSFSRTQTFRDIDKDKTGKIDIDEFAKMCEMLGWKLNKQQKQDVFKKFDDDGSGEVSLNEFFITLEQLKFDRANLASE